MDIITKPEKFNSASAVHWCAFGLGSGLFKKAPGTWGSAMGILLAVPMLTFAKVHLMVILVLAFVVGVYLCAKTAKDLGVHDHGGIVWDEFVGQWLVLFFLPQINLFYVVLSFLLFRLFDILKPWPIKWLDNHVHGGFGIMIDDVLAGMFALLVIYFVYIFELHEALLSLGFTSSLPVVGLP